MNQFYGFMGKVFDKAVETSKTVAIKASEVYHDESVRQSAREISHKVLDTTKELGSKLVTESKTMTETVSVNVREKGIVNYSKELGARALDKTVDVGNQVYDFTVSTATEVKQQAQEKGVVTYTKELTGKSVDKVKQGYNDTLNYVKTQRNSHQRANPLVENNESFQAISYTEIIVDGGETLNEGEERKDLTQTNTSFPPEKF